MFYWFVIFGILRLCSISPLVIDDDEAWWSASAHSMKWPWHSYRVAVDDKPPGMNTYYWITQNLFPHGADPRVARAFYVLLTLAAAVLIGRLAVKLRNGRGVDWAAATLFSLASAAVGPKLLAVTSDGLLTLLVVAAYAVAFEGESIAALMGAGALLGAAILVKQTAVFFALPFLFARSPKKWNARQLAAAAAGAAAVVTAFAAAAGLNRFVFWNWTYPSSVLPAARGRIFDAKKEFLESFAIFSVAMGPLLGSAFKTFRSRWSDFRVLWLAAAAMAVAAGKGVFLHYFLMAIPPLVLSVPRPRRRVFVWLAIPYVFSCLILLVPASAIFWGTDLSYFETLGRVTRKIVPPAANVLVWGGSPLPFVYIPNPHATRFLVPRFAVAPFGTKATAAEFHADLARRPPDLVIDLHERQDNRFNNPLESEPFVWNMIRTHYALYVSPALPWAKFYLRRPPPPGAGLCLIKDDARRKEVYRPFPDQKINWPVFLNFISKFRLGRDWVSLRSAETRLRILAALELVARQGGNRGIRRKAELFRHDIETRSGPRAVSAAGRWLRAFGRESLEPVPLNSPAWWPEAAAVELQGR